MYEKQPPHKDWSPPEGYMQIESKVAGVTLFAPEPEAIHKDQPKNFACPNCGANVTYDVAAGGIACEYCGYLAPVRGINFGKTADEFEFTLETLSHAAHGWGIQRQRLHCESCGGELSIPEGAISTTCPFCASNQVNVTTSLEEELRPRFLIPFKITPEQTQKLAAAWLGTGWYHPDELASGSFVRHYTGIYLPFWTFDAVVRAYWRAQVGYEKTEQHYNAHEKRWETRTRIVWRWEDGEVHLTVDDHLVTGSAPNHISHKILARLYPYHLHDLMTYEPDYLAGWQAQAYETTLMHAWETGKAAIREKARQACDQAIPSHHVRNFSMQADFRDESWRYILLPVFLATYKYNDKVFQMMINGQTGVVAGQKPVAWWKVWLAIAALLSPGAILGIIGLPLLMLAGTGVILIALGIILFIIGGIISISLYGKAQQSEAK